MFAGYHVITIVVALIVVGLLLWAIGQLPIDGTILQLIRAVVVVACVLWLLQAFGLMPRALARGWR